MATEQGVKISQLPDWTGGISIVDSDLFEVARDGVSYKISATTLATAIVKTILDNILSQYALKKNTVGYPAEQLTAALTKWKVTDSCLFEELHVNKGFLKNTQIDGILNNTRSFLYSADFEREHAGFSVWKSTGGWNIECDNLYVRKVIKAKEYVIEQISALKGTVVLSAANGKIKSVIESTYNGKDVYEIAFDEELLSYVEGDIILCQTYGDPKDVSTQKRYIAVVQGITTDKERIILNKSDFVDAAGTNIQDLPAVEDETVQYGNISDVDRQGIIQESAAYNLDGSGSKPYISIITGVNGRYGTDTPVEDLVEGNISTAGKTRSLFGHLKDLPYVKAELNENPSSDFGILTDNGLFQGRVITTQGNVIDLLTIGGDIDQYWNVSGGTAGIYGGDEASTPKSNDTASPVRFFAGGDYSKAKQGLTPVVIKSDGSGFLANGNVSWDDVGNTKIIGELTIVTPSGNQDLITYLQNIQGDLQNQIDKAVESWFYPFDPADDRPPVTTWIDESVSTERPLASVLKQHINDTFTNVWDGTPGVDPNTGVTKGGIPGASWRWTLKASTTGDNISDYQWTQITDSVLTEVLEQLGELSAATDGKVTTYFTSYSSHSKEGISATDPPYNYHKGDLWYNAPTTSIKVANKDNSTYDYNDWDIVVDSSLDYLKNTFQEAFNNNTKIIGGLISTSVLRLGGNQTTSSSGDVWVEQAGLSGMNATQSDAIRAWFGGQLNSDNTTNAPIWFKADGTAKIGRLTVETNALKFYGKDSNNPILTIDGSSETLQMNGSGTFTGTINATGGTFNNLTATNFTIRTGQVGPFYITTDNQLIATLDGNAPQQGSITGFMLRGGGSSLLGWHLYQDENNYIQCFPFGSESGSTTSWIKITTNKSQDTCLYLTNLSTSTSSSVAGFSNIPLTIINYGKIYHEGTLSKRSFVNDGVSTLNQIDPRMLNDVVFVGSATNIDIMYYSSSGDYISNLTKSITFINNSSSVSSTLNFGSWILHDSSGEGTNKSITIPGRGYVRVFFDFTYSDAYVIGQRL